MEVVVYVKKNFGRKRCKIKKWILRHILQFYIECVTLMNGVASAQMIFSVF